MKFLIFSLFLSQILFAKKQPIEESIIVKSSYSKKIKKLQKKYKFIVDHVHQRTLEVYGPKGTLKILKRNGLKAAFQKINKSRVSYPSYGENVSKLKKLHKDHPEITKLFSIGKSVEGRDLWVMKISDNPNKDEFEPEFKYISSMHGDEIVGRELLILFMDDLLKMYKKKNKNVVDLVNNTEIFILPSMNPDGSEVPKRANANGVDLNRNFPDFTTADNINTPDGREPETQAIMKWQKKRHFSLSANFHGGAVVVNYPWDTKAQRHPMDKFVVKFSKYYASFNQPMSENPEFPGGIVNGSDWYEVNGGMQDWSYHWHNDLQVTIELSNTKYPDYSTISKYYKDNRKSLFNFINVIHSGTGFKLDSIKARGKVEIVQVKPITRKLGQFSFHQGEFYKVLPVGKYKFKIKLSDGTSEIRNLEVK